MQESLTPFELATRIQEATGELPAMPHVAAEALERLSGDTATAADLDQLISKDASLASRVLRIANSSFYARGGQVKTVKQAIINVGFSTIRNAIAAAAMRGLYQTFGPREQLLWEHSLGCGLAARVVAQHTRAAPPDQAFLAGLLHDIGRTVLLLRLPAQMGPILEAAAAGQVDDTRPQEVEAFGFDHTDVGRLLARRWKFGEDMEEAIGQHHSPSEAVHAGGLCNVVAMADLACRRLGIGEGRCPDLDVTADESARALGVDPVAGGEMLQEIEFAFAAGQGQLGHPV